MTISRHPAYSQFDQIGRRILSPRVALGGDADKLLCLRPTHAIYEYWCFFTVAEAVQQALPEFTWTDNASVSAGNILMELKNGSRVVGRSDNVRVSVIFQQSYSSRPAKNGLFSISKKCIPDIVLNVEEGDLFRTIIFDAKYRSGESSIHAALSDMHVYRDAIRNTGDQRAVESAFILTPAHDSKAARFYTEEYRQRHSFGAFDLSPRDVAQFEELVRAVRRLVLGHGETPKTPASTA